MHRLLLLTTLAATVALAAVAPGGLAATATRVTPPSAGKYRGTTAQGLATSFTVSSKHHVKPGTFRARLKCPDGKTFVFTEHWSHTSIAILSDGSIGKPYSGPDGNGNPYTSVETVRRYGRKGAKGTVHITDTDPAHGGVCDSGVVTWKAKRT